MSDYLIILCSHIDNVEKKNTVLESLQYFKENNIDVCFSTHSGEFLTEISEQVKFITYDSNNEFLSFQDYVDNAKFIENKYKYGYPNGTSYHDFGYTSISMPGSPHSKSALSLLRNGIIVSQHNKYKWTVYLEYDITQPINGFKQYVENIINELESKNKKCFYYNNIFDGFSFLWGGLFIFNTESVFSYKKLINGNWFLSKKDWIKEWYLGFFESVVEYCFVNIFKENEIHSEIIQEKVSDVWGVDNVSEISLYKYESNYYQKNKYLRKIFEIHLYPEINKFGDKKLHLYYYNRGEQKIKLNEILVYSKNSLHLNIKNIEILPHHWFRHPINIDNLSVNDTVTLIWDGETNGEKLSTKEEIRIGDIEKIEDNIIKIVFNN